MSKTYRALYILACLSYSTAFIPCLAPNLLAQNAARVPRPRIPVTRPVDPPRLRTLPGNTRSEANAQNDLGKVSDSLALDHMLLQLQRNPERQRALEDLMAEQQDSTSPNFHKWLTAVEFGQLYGPEPEDIEKVSTWLRAGGFTVNTVYPNGMLIDFSGTAGQVSAAFGTEIHDLSVEGAHHIANMANPQIPEALAPVVAGVVSLHDFRPRSMRKPRAQYTASYGGYTTYALVPADLATIYNLNPAFAAGFTGKGQTIAVVEDSDLYDATDWTTFRNVFALSGYTSGSLNTVNPPPPSGTSNCADPGATSAGAEATLDAEWASAAAPDAAIVVAACKDTATTFGVLIASENLINSASPPRIVSVSYGECETAAGATANAAYNAAAQQAAAEGVSVFVAAGDAGAATCDAWYSAATHGIGVSNIAASPYSVAVGGTDFADLSQGTVDQYWSRHNNSADGSALSYIPEIPWNDSCAGSILTAYEGYDLPYGPTGFCGSLAAQFGYNLNVSAGGGGPSGCATGAPSENLVVSGTCQGFAKPAWQTGVPGIPNDGVRGLPDVSLFAATGMWSHYYVTCYTDYYYGGAPRTDKPFYWFGGGGTSYGAPIMAGIQALVNQKMGSPQGNPNPVYYKLAAGPAAATVFHSITAGDIAVPCSGTIDCYGAGFQGRGRATPTTWFDGNGVLSIGSQSYTPAFAAGPGWNFATGLGSVDAFNLIMNWPKAQ